MESTNSKAATAASNTRAVWFGTDDSVDDDGFFRSGSDNKEEAFEGERESLAEWGAPDTDQIVFESILPEDRDLVVVVAAVPPSFLQWLEENEMLEMPGS